MKTLVVKMLAMCLALANSGDKRVIEEEDGLWMDGYCWQRVVEGGTRWL